MTKSRKPTVKVMFLGLRGIGGIQGGVETHVAELVRHLPFDRSEIEVIGRTPYRRTDLAPDPTLPRVRWLPTLRNSFAEALVHSLLGTLYAAWHRPQLLHIHAIGPNIVTPLARLLGLKVVATHHGEDYRREKWGHLARWVLRFGERQSVLSSRACIAISPVVAESLREKYGRPVDFIPNGVTAMERVSPGETLAKLGLAPGRYVLNVARLVPEKRQLDLIEAFEAAGIEDTKLVLVGGADHKSEYAQRVRERAQAARNVILAGHVSGEPLAELFWNAGLFVLPSSHEGLPIVLLEAMSAQLPVLVSDLPVYRHMGIPDNCIVPVGDVAALGEHIRARLAGDRPVPDWSDILLQYQWPRIAAATAEVYDKAGS